MIVAKMKNSNIHIFTFLQKKKRLHHSLSHSCDFGMRCILRFFFFLASVKCFYWLFHISIRSFVVPESNNGWWQASILTIAVRKLPRFSTKNNIFSVITHFYSGKLKPFIESQSVGWYVCVCAAATVNGNP